MEERITKAHGKLTMSDQQAKAFKKTLDMAYASGGALVPGGGEGENPSRGGGLHKAAYWLRIERVVAVGHHY